MSVLTRVRDRVLESPLVYRAWQAPFAARKLEPVLRHNDLATVRRVLDLACGPGTNTPYFDGVDYVGVDINPAYTATARDRYGRTFITADITQYRHEDGEPFDFILLNSFLHHLPDADVQRILSHTATLLSDDGHVHVLDLILPDRPSLARALARADRGGFARPLEAWRALLREHFTTVVLEPYSLDVAGVPAWQMLYFKGKAR